MAEFQNNISIRDVKTKRPWRRYLPQREIVQPAFTDWNEPPYSPGTNFFETATQASFLAEYYPTAHRINSEHYYPNIWRTVTEKVVDPSTGEYAIDENGQFITEEHIYCEMVPRYSFPFQQIIAFAHIYHATSNDLQHELAIPDPSDAQNTLFNNMCAAWTSWGMEEAWYFAYKAREITGDTAFVGTISEGKFSWRVFSYQNGDVIYPHYDLSGRLRFLARQTFQYDENGTEKKETIEIWDDAYYYVYTRNTGDNRTIAEKVRDIFGLDNYTLTYQEKHGFSRIPVAYMRNDDGPGWSASQSSIEDYELTFSQMAHNNQAYGEAILVTKTKGEMPVDITRGLNGTIKQIDMDSESEAHYLEGQSASESYMKQLEKTEEMIYRGSEIVKSPAELKAGDTPATAIKLLFTPNMQRATSDLEECNEFISELWRIFASAYGHINNCIVDAESLPVINWGIPFVPQSESAITADLVSLVNAKIISRQTAAERCPFYSKPGETKKVDLEEKKRRDADLLVEIEEIKASQRVKASQNSNSNDGE